MSSPNPTSHANENIYISLGPTANEGGSILCSAQGSKDGPSMAPMEATPIKTFKSSCGAALAGFQLPVGGRIYDFFSELHETHYGGVYEARVSRDASAPRLLVKVSSLHHALGFVKLRGKHRARIAEDIRMEAAFIHYLDLHAPSVAPAFVAFLEDGINFYTVTELMCPDSIKFDLLEAIVEKRLIRKPVNALEGAHYYAFLGGVAGQCLRALAGLHAAGIVHADVSPENLMFKDATAAEVRIIDYGAAFFANETASLTSAAMRGKHAYVAPETVKADPAPPSMAGDVWGMGATLLYCLLPEGAAFLAAIRTNNAVAWHCLARLRSRGLDAFLETLGLKDAFISEAPPSLVPLLREMLHPAPEDRCTAAVAVGRLAAMGL